MTRPRVRGRRFRHTATVIVFALALVGCVSSSRTDRDYELKAANTAKAALSEIQTAGITTQAALDRRAPGAYVSVLLRDAETSLGSIQQTFESVQPPSTRADELRDQLGKILSAAADALSGLRIAARRGDAAALREASAPLEGIAEQLDRFEQEHE